VVRLCENERARPPRGGGLSVEELTRDVGPVRAVSDLDGPAVARGIEALACRLAGQILRGEGFTFDVPSRARGNQHYVAELDRIVLRDATSRLPFSAPASCRKAAVLARVLQLVHELCLRGIHVTKRDLFYTDVKRVAPPRLGAAGHWFVFSVSLSCSRAPTDIVRPTDGHAHSLTFLVPPVHPGSSRTSRAATLSSTTPPP